MSYGTRVDHRAGGFSDRLMALGMACHTLLGGTLPKKLDAKVIEVVDKNSPAEKIDEWLKSFDRTGQQCTALKIR